uniref:DUF4283 domain-containing protein n=1 Tax=Chenopodium quinoa TaxID=63459 RepID=A0A803L0E4_CHEQI
MVIGADLGESEDGFSKAIVNLSLVGKLLTKKPYNVEAMKHALKNLWRLIDNVAIRMINTNFFIFQFFNEDDKNKVLEGRLLLNVPFGKRNYTFAEELGGFLEFDDSDPLGWDEFIRVKVMINITKPLRRGIKISTGSSILKWVGFKYERLGTFVTFVGELGMCIKTASNKTRLMGKVWCSNMVLSWWPHFTKGPRLLWRRKRERKWFESFSSNKGSKRISYNDPKAIKLGPPSSA